MVKTFLLSLISLSALVLLTGCGEEAKTKEYYSQHIEEAKMRAEACKKLEKFNEVQQLDCQNANFAIMSKRNSNSNYGKSVDTSFLSKLPGTGTNSK